MTTMIPGAPRSSSSAARAARFDRPHRCTLVRTASRRLTYRPGGTLAASDALKIVVRGRQTHGAMPWGGVDPVVVSAQIINALQSIPSRQMDVTLAPSIVTVAMIHGGVRNNIIPDSVVMEGRIRTLDKGQQTDIHQRVKRTVEKVAESFGRQRR